VTNERFFSNPEFLGDLRELYTLRLILEDEGLCEVPTNKLKYGGTKNKGV
jgi:hypothetical protein